MRDTYDLAMEWLEEKHSDALERVDIEELLILDWIMDRLYFDNDMRNS